MKVALLHGYSARNLGDGLLVREAVEVIHAALGESVEITLVALDPASFDVNVHHRISARPSMRGFDSRYLATLCRFGTFDCVVGVGGGYLRGRRGRELAKTAIVHAPQLLCAALSRTPAVYLPQSIGPFPRPAAVLARLALKRLDRVYVRDDRSLAEYRNSRVVRAHDLALSTRLQPLAAHTPIESVPVLSFRNLDGKDVPPAGLELATRLGIFDAYIQSSVGGNDDTHANKRLQPRSLLQPEELSSGVPRRIVVAMRLHAALMAISAGHYVIHLAYERKGYGAFHDLGLAPYVHPARSFDPTLVEAQVRAFANNPRIRAEYDRQVQAARHQSVQSRESLVTYIRALAGSR